MKGNCIMENNEMLQIDEGVSLEELLKSEDDSNNKDYIEENICNLCTDNLSDAEINKEKFVNGVNDVSYLCGAISALVSVGINPNKAMDYIVDKEATKLAMEHSIAMANIQKEISIETSKLNFVDKANNF